MTALSWSMDQLTDGAVPEHMLTVLDGTRREANALVMAGLWVTTEDGWAFHDWSDYQPSRAQVLADREAAKERQRRARERAKSARESRRDEPVTHGEVHPGVTVPPTRPIPKPSPNGEGRTSEVADATPDTTRPDIDHLCVLLADLVEGNGARRPQITKRWRDAARLLLDRDGYTVEQVEWIARWATAHEFWRANILSMPTLRERFDQLKLQATANGSRTTGRRSPAEDAQATIALGERMQAEHDRRQLGAS